MVDQTYTSLDAVDSFVSQTIFPFPFQAFSTSSIWYAILDFGTNYCNLRNLLDGTGLSNSIGQNLLSFFNCIFRYFVQGAMVKRLAQWLVKQHDPVTIPALSKCFF